MLTDRQNKFLVRMTDLAKDNSSATNAERGYLNRSVNLINNGRKFQESVNMLNLSLRGLQRRKEKPLTEDVGSLYFDLIAVYGNPKYTLGVGVTVDTGIDCGTYWYY